MYDDEPVHKEVPLFREEEGPGQGKSPRKDGTRSFSGNWIATAGYEAAGMPVR